MAKIRVLVVDDSVVIRRLVTEALNADPALEVVGIAANGRIALSKLSQVQSDIVTLDVEMPELNGLETLAEIRKTHPHLPVIMFSTLTARGAAATLDALALGANDYVTKPANVGSVSEALQRLRDELIPKIKHFCGNAPPAVAQPRPAAHAQARMSTPPAHLPAATQRIDVVALGVSTGGPDALLKLVPNLPADLPVPILAVQHMPPIFTKLLADRLNAISHIRVQEAAPGDRPEPGGMWIAPGDFHLVAARNNGTCSLNTNQAPRENSCRPAVDVLFRSVVEAYGPHVLGVILTGMGQDGLRGCELIRQTGGRVIAQDEATSVVWGMPGFVARAGLANSVLPLGEIAGEIVRRTFAGNPHSFHMSSATPVK
jgi:two-component system chemotaxis response regulator CheB